MLNEFEEWFTLNEPLLRDRNVRIQLTRPEVSSDKNSVYVDVDTDSRMARVTLWDTGECDMEVINPETEETILYEHTVLQSSKELSAALESFFGKLQSHKR